jgi:hypothetical protein
VTSAHSHGGHNSDVFIETSGARPHPHGLNPQILGDWDVACFTLLNVG